MPDHDRRGRQRALFSARVARHEAAQPGYGQSWRALCRDLLSYGGDLVVATDTPDPVVSLLVGGRLRFDPGQAARIVRGRRRECHQNVIRRWRSGKLRIVTGYALSDDGLWRPHSWGLDADDRVVETTDAREMYAGVVLDDVESEAFARANELPD